MILSLTIVAFFLAISKGASPASLNENGNGQWHKDPSLEFDLWQKDDELNQDLLILANIIIENWAIKVPLTAAIEWFKILKTANIPGDGIKVR